MNSPSSGGPAFPQPNAYTNDDGSQERGGMSLRDYFAIHAQPQDFALYLCEYERDADRYINRTPAEARYAFADAMIRARSK
jgi:hypothetical protein